MEYVILPFIFLCTYYMQKYLLIHRSLYSVIHYSISIFCSSTSIILFLHNMGDLKPFYVFITLSQERFVGFGSFFL